jgi:hypothetical protein
MGQQRQRDEWGLRTDCERGRRIKNGISKTYIEKYQNALIAPKSGAPGKIARTDGRANRAVRQTPRMSVSYQFISILTFLW